MRSTTALVAFAVCLLGTTVALSAEDQRGQPRPTTNLQVLPKEWTTADIQPVMQQVAASLGVQCTHCHERDRSLDTKPTKLVARKMLQMTMTINDELLKDVGEPAADGARKVTCYTCHRGSLKPATAPPDGGN
jgi:hypothetical protein